MHARSLAFLALILAGCSDSSSKTKPDDDAGAPSTEDSGSGGESTLTVDGPISGGKGLYLNATSFDLASVGYEQAEYFLEGTAQAYAADGDLGTDGKWSVVPANTAEFKTRIVVYRPTDASKFNGSVFVEWLNVSGGTDAAADWMTGHVELIRKGYVYVGVSAQKVGVEGGGSIIAIPGAGDASLKGVDAERYGSLHHPGDSYSYDIFSQAGHLLRHPGKVDPLDGLVPKRIIGAGESQSAFRMVTYIDAIDPVAKAYDGYLVHSRGAGGAALSEAPEPVVTGGGSAHIREDTRVPVLTFETETDLITLGFLPDRQPDSERVHTWEVAGTAHADTYLLSTGASDVGDDPSIADVVELTSPSSFFECGTPVNSGPQHFVLKAAIAALETWIKDGTEPPAAPQLQVSGSPPAYALDDNGNVKGGIRTAHVDAPVATLSGLGQSGGGFCGIFGTTKKFDAKTLAGQYSSHDDYVAKVKAATDAAETAGFLLKADADLIRKAAEQSDIGE